MILDSNPRRWNSSVDGLPVRGGDALRVGLRKDRVAGFAVGLGLGPREKLFTRRIETCRACARRLPRPRLIPPCFPNAFETFSPYPYSPIHRG